MLEHCILYFEIFTSDLDYNSVDAIEMLAEMDVQKDSVGDYQSLHPCPTHHAR